VGTANYIEAVWAWTLTPRGRLAAH
jgi:hypothetical protein